VLVRIGLRINMPLMSCAHSGVWMLELVATGEEIMSSFLDLHS